MSNEPIEKRIAGRHFGGDLASLITADDLACRPFMEGLVDELKRRGQLDPPPAPTSKVAPIGILGACVITFGAHKGKTLDDIPLEYLDWLCRESEDLLRDLRAYLRHPDLESRRRGLDG